ncbi:unnamed protein product [Oncorhynchus mykiss]|uniref:Uncharacterized protein n=1 Tax=Oncorhynchus mykiss TaxID=8022 RepID=A0A060YD37_ONCMY|nr:unnamed protein product [Oncorhynchus mykiss]
MAHVRTYRPDVRVGNWREDVTLEEVSVYDANSKVLISHCKTNQALAVLGQHILWTPFGKEYEVTVVVVVLVI